MPTLQELLELPYEKSPFQDGIISGDYRSQFRADGESVRVWTGYETSLGETVVGPNGETPDRNGTLWVEMDIADEVRVIVQASERDLMDAEFGLVPKGSTTICNMPDEIYLSRRDRVLLVDREVVGKAAVQLSGGSVDLLPRLYITSIDKMFGSAGLVDPDNYELNDEGTGIHWIGTTPGGTVTVLYKYNPLYDYLAVSDRAPMRGKDGALLPQRSVLTLVKV